MAFNISNVQLWFNRLFNISWTVELFMFYIGTRRYFGQCTSWWIWEWYDLDVVDMGFDIITKIGFSSITFASDCCNLCIESWSTSIICFRSESSFAHNWKSSIIFDIGKSSSTNSLSFVIHRASILVLSHWDEDLIRQYIVIIILCNVYYSNNRNNCYTFSFKISFSLNRILFWFWQVFFDGFFSFQCDGV